MKPLFSIIIPVRIKTKYLGETIKHLKKQTCTSFELLVITDNQSKTPSPAVKRNLGAKKAQGEFLAFLDDDSYPDKDWLKNAADLFKNNPQIAALGGPCLTPPNDSISQKASGLVWSTWLGSGGAGWYRNSIQSQRYVLDFPSVNLIVRKSDFQKIHGYDEQHWPGEDTLLCRDIITKLNKKILYDPSIRVYHHRRAVIIPHLQQIHRYAVHRGYFARVYPENSRLLGYFMPSFFVLYLITTPLIYKTIFIIPLIIYLLALISTFIKLLISKNNIISSLLALITIPITHVYYGTYFIYGFLSPQLKFTAHQVNTKNQTYLGG